MKESGKNNLIHDIEEIFISLGLERMSTYFHDEVFENGISAYHILWNKDSLYYVLKSLEYNKIQILYAYDLGDTFKYLDTLDVDKTTLKEDIQNIINGWTPEEKEVLSKYIDLYANKKFSYKIQFIATYAKNSSNYITMNIKEKNQFYYEFGHNIEIDKSYVNYLKLYDQNVDSLFLLSNLIEIYNHCLLLLGENHPNTIALLYEIKIEFSYDLSIEEMLEICIKIYNYHKNIDGRSGLNTLNSILNIALYLGEMEKYKDAILLTKYVCRNCKNEYGDKYIYTIKANQLLLVLYYNFGQYGKALSIAKECLYDASEYEDIIYIKKCIAKIYRSEAFENYEESLKYELSILNDEQIDDSKKIEVMNDLAYCYERLNEIDKAITYQSDVIDIALDMYGKMDLKVLEYCFQLSTLLTKAKEFEKALKLDLSIYAKVYKQYGQFDLFAMEVKNAIIIDLVHLNRKEEAMKIAGVEYLDRKNNLGDDDEYTIISRTQYIDLKEGKWFE